MPILDFVTPIKPGTLTAVTALVTNTSYFIYLGRYSNMGGCKINYRVTTAGTTITWAELGLFKGNSVPGSTVSLSRIGFLDVSGVVNSTGLKVSTLTVDTTLHGGESIELWGAYGAQATIVPILRGVVADDLQSGQFQQAAGRISTLAIPSTTTLASATLVPAWLSYQIYTF